MRGNLEHGIRRGVADRPAGAQMRLAMRGDDRHTRGVAIAQDARCPGQLADQRHQLFGKGRNRVGEVGPVPWHRHPGQFPMARGCILAPAHLGCGTPAALGLRAQTRRAQARGKLNRRAQAQRIKVGQVQRPRAALIRPPFGAGQRDMAQRIGPGVAKIGRIGCAAAADRIHHDQKGPRHLR